MTPEIFEKLTSEEAITLMEARYKVAYANLGLKMLEDDFQVRYGEPVNGIFRL